MHKQRAIYAGVLILVAYSMLTYTFTDNKTLGFITDILSGLSVIGIPVMLFPVFNSPGNRGINYAYIISRSIEGTLMIIGGIFILIPSLEPYRERIYTDIHIYFFISGALFFYILFYRTRAIPGFISIWGIIATILLFLTTIIKLLGFEHAIMDLPLLPMILNEVFLAFWLIIKGIKLEDR